MNQLGMIWGDLIGACARLRRQSYREAKSCNSFSFSANLLYSRGWPSLKPLSFLWRSETDHPLPSRVRTLAKSVKGSPATCVPRARIVPLGLELPPVQTVESGTVELFVIRGNRHIKREIK
jgi:hypothetical protein